MHQVGREAQRPVILVVDDSKQDYDGLLRSLAGYDRGRLRREFEFECLDSFVGLRDWYRQNQGRFVSLIVQDVDFSRAGEGCKLISLDEVKHPVPVGLDTKTFQGFLIYSMLRHGNIDRIVPVLFAAGAAGLAKVQRLSGFVVYPGYGGCSFVEAGPESERFHIEVAEGIDAAALRPLGDDERRHWRERHEMVIGRSRRMAYLAREIERIGPSEATVLLLGRSGVGKELVANALHRCSRSAADNGKPQLPHTVNIAAFDKNLVEDELFGHERGAFTGAVSERKGAFEAAEGSTVFLDEIGDIGPEMQLKLLRTMEYHRVKRLGSPTEVSVDIRIIAATNKSVEELHLRFRPDFYSRLAQHCILVPSLLERWQDEHSLTVRQDIEELAGFVIDEMNRSPRYRRNLSVDVGAADFLCQMVEEFIAGNNDIFQGNIRTLRNIVERSYERAQYDESPAIRIGHVISTAGVVRFTPIGLGPEEQATMKQAVGSYSLREAEKKLIAEALAECRGNQFRAAGLLGIHRDTLRRKIAEYGI